MFKKIKKEIDNSIGKSPKEIIDHVKRALDRGIPYAMLDFTHSQRMETFLKEQLDRVSIPAIQIMTDMSLRKIRKMEGRISTKPSPLEIYMDFEKDEYNAKKAEMLMLMAIKKIPQVYLFSEPLPGITDELGSQDRQLLATYCHYMISILAVKTNWQEDSVKAAMSILAIEYTICIQDGVMDLFFNSAMSVISRLNSSMLRQQARDLAATILIIGHREHLEEYSYVTASSAYIDASNPLEALLYQTIALAYIERKYKVIPKRLAFDIIWNVLKTLREINRINGEEIAYLLTFCDSIECNAFERLSVYFTALSARAFAGDETAVGDIISYLKTNDAEIRSFKKRVSLPLFTLFKSIHEVYGDHDLSELAPYEEMVAEELEIDGNELYVDFFDDDNKELANHLRKIMLRLSSSRYAANFPHDSIIAQKLARKVIELSLKEENPEMFLLAMMVRADFTFVKQEYFIAPFTVMEIKDIEIKKDSQPYLSVSELKNYLKTEHEDIMIWIGLGTNHVCRLLLLNDMFCMDQLEAIEEADYQKTLRQIIPSLQFESDYVTEKGDRFDKTVKELEEEEEHLFEMLRNYRFSLPNVAGRVLLVKDMELEPYPHHLFVDGRTDEFIGKVRPTANVISTELLIKTNRSDLQLPMNFSKSFWIPVSSGEITFSGIKDHLEETLLQYQFHVVEDILPLKPLSSDLNIVCAHGGKNISESEWFYANSQPIIDTSKIVGNGKILVLLVCHSGSAVYKDYDGAVRTFIKRYVRMGYKSIIAPMWSLPIDILPLWVSTFMDRFSGGEYIIDSVFHANMAVMEKFIAPSAWACLHLFGNPYLQVEKNKDIPRNDEID